MRRQDRSPFVQAGMRALAQLNGQRFHGTVDDETVTFHDITLPGIVGVHQMQIELQGADGKILLVSAHQIDVVPGPPGTASDFAISSRLSDSLLQRSLCC